MLNFNRNEFVFSISFALDFLEMGIMKNVTNHNKQVGFIALQIGKTLGLDRDSLMDLSAYAMLHDNGFTHKAYNAAAEDGVHKLELSHSHCIVGERNLASFPFLKRRENVIQYHHEQYNGQGFFGVQKDDIPLFSQIIALADKTDALYRRAEDDKEVMQYVSESKGVLYSPELCDAFGTAASQRSFWLSLHDLFVGMELANLLLEQTIDVGLDELLQMSDILCNIIDAKSPFTGTHSKGLVRWADIMADFYGFDPEHKTKLLIAANLHDLGKIVTPNAILDKDGKLTSDEFKIISAHTFYTRKALQPVKEIKDIMEWAANHHEKLNGTGYPYGFSKKDLDFESQLMACIDIYQALTENRPYRQPMPHARAAEIMGEMAKRGFINGDIVGDLLKRSGEELQKTA
jgi:HD-GYP domain-containing protein (c-di-GMP phosphodiesterase class II)